MFLYMHVYSREAWSYTHKNPYLFYVPFNQRRKEREVHEKWKEKIKFQQRMKSVYQKLGNLYFEYLKLWHFVGSYDKDL